MEKRYHTVSQGECLYTIAEKYGFCRFRTIYEHEKNRELREKRPDMHCLYPGDRVFIPDKKNEPIPVRGRRSIKVIVPKPKVWFSLVLKDSEAKAMVGINYRLTIGEQNFTGQTDRHGRIKHGHKETTDFALLELFPDEDNPASKISLNLKIAHLDPVEQETGIQARLKNQGYYPGEIDGEIGPATEQAIKRFQSDHGLEVTGTPCPDTLAKLSEVYDGSF